MSVSLAMLDAAFSGAPDTMAEAKESCRQFSVFPEAAAPIDQHSALAALCDSAESVLRDEPVRGPLALIEDARDRRRAAVELMQLPASANVREAWLPSRPELRTHPALVADADDRSCPCGTSIRAHQEDDMPLMPLCWHLFTTSTSVGIRRRIHRSQAVAEFEWTLFHVVQTAFGEGPSSRVSAAWRVIDGIDRGERLIPALAAFFRVSRAAIKASRSLPLGAAYVDIAPTRARRFLRAFWELRQAPTIDGGEKSDLARWLPVLDLIASNTHHSVVVLVRTLPLRAVEVMVARETTKTQRRSLLRWIIRRSRSGARDAAKDWQKFLLRWRSKSGSQEGADSAPSLSLGSAWLAIPLRDAYDLWREGEEMAHCVFGLRRELERGDTAVYSVRSGRTPERVTVSVSAKNGAGGPDPAVCLEARGHRIGAISLEATQAVLDLLRIIERPLAPRRLRVVLGHL